MYYVFENSLKNEIAYAMSQAKGEGFYDFKPHQKCTGITSIPNSNTDPTPIKDYRTVFVLETNFAPEDAQLEAQARALAEFVNESPTAVLEYLESTDN